MRQIHFQCFKLLSGPKIIPIYLFPGRFKIYIENGWNIPRFTDPSGSISEELARKDLHEKSLYVLNLTLIYMGYFDYLFYMGEGAKSPPPV